MFEGGPFWPNLVWVLPLLLIGAVWLAVAVIVHKGEDVDRPNRMAHLYGYTVCLISLVIALITLSSILNAAFDRANPLQSESPFGASLTSFESYKANPLSHGQVYNDRSHFPGPFRRSISRALAMGPSTQWFSTSGCLTSA